MRACFLLSLALATGCASGFSLSIDLRTDLVVGVEISNATTELIRPAGPMGTMARPLSSTSDYATGARIADYSGLAAGDYTVRVTLYDRSAIAVVSRTVRVSLHGDLATTVVVTRDCRGVTCPTAADPTATTCAGGVCVNPSCGPSSTTCGRECAADTDCHAAASCALGRCASGVCLFEAMPGACPAGAWCDPEHGCQPFPVDLPDAGRDAGSPDAGGPPDLGPPDLGPVGTDAGPPPPSGLWMLPHGASAWNVYDRGDGTLHAPTTAVRDAFSLDGCDRAYAITDTTYHVLTLSSRTWSDSGARDSLFPQLTGRGVQSVFSIPPRDGTCGSTDVIFLSGTDALLYNWGGAAFAYSSTVAMPWAADPRAPSPTTVIADWLSLDDDAGWITGSPYELCPTGPAMPPPGSVYGPYSAFLTSDGRLFLQDDGFCSVFIRDVPFSSFAPFTLAGAPAFGDVGAVFHAGGALWVMRQ